MAALAILLGASVLLGWAANSLWVTRLNDKFIPMSPAAALCFVLFGVVLLCRQRQPDEKIARHVWQTLAIILLLLNVAVFIQSTFFNIPDLLLNLLQRLAPDPLAGQNYAVGVMSPLTASLFVILSFAVLLSPRARAVARLRDHVAQSAAVFVLAIAHIIMIGYWYGTPLLYGGATVPVALTTAIGFIFLSGGFLFESASAWLFRWLTSDSVSSRFTRVIIPGVIGVILINGWIQLTIFSQLPAAVLVLSSSLVAIFIAALISLLVVVVARQTQTAITRAEYALRGSEKRFRALIENAADVIVIIDVTGIIRFASPAAESVLGYKPEEAIGKNFLEWVHPDNLSEVAQSFAHRSQTPGTAGSSLIVRGRHKDGSWRFIEAIGTNLLDEPTVQGIVLNMRDVTKRKRAEEALRIQEARFRSLIENSHDGVALIDLNGMASFVSPSAARILGYETNDPFPIFHAELIHPEDRPQVEMFMQSWLQEGAESSSHLVYRHRHKDGTWRWLGMVATNLLGDLAVGAIVLNFDDITTQKEIEIKLRYSEAMLNEAQRIALVGSFEVAFEKRQTVWSDEFYQVLGLAPQQKKPSLKLFLRQVHPQDRRQLLDVYLIAKRNNAKCEFTHRVRLEDGREKFACVRFEFRRDEQGEQILVGTAQDITERKQAEEALRLSETMLKASQRVAHVGHYIFDVRQGSWSSSEALDDIFGINDSYPRTVEGWADLVAPDYRAQMSAYFSDHVLRDHHPFDKEYPLRHASDGALRWVHGTGELEFDNSGQPVKMFGTIQDITSYKDTEGKLYRRAEQLAILNDISSRVTLSTSVNEVLQRVAQLVQDRFHYHHVGLFLYDAEHAELVLRAKAGNFTHLFPLDHHVQPDQGMVSWVCRERRTLLANDVRLEPSYVTMLGNLIPTRSELSVPIQSGESLFGVIDLQSAEINAFEDNDVLLIETLAQQIVAALENARLHEWAFRELAERERHEREMDAVIRMGATLRDVASRTELAEAVLPDLCELLGVEHALFGVADLLTGERVVIGACGNWTPLQGQRFATSFARQIAPNGIPRLVEDKDRSKFARPELFEGLDGVAVTQLLINEEQLGSLWIGSAHLINEDTLRLFALLSGLVANVVQRVNSVERTEQHLRRLTAVHEIILATSHSLELSPTLTVLLNQVRQQLNVDAADVLLYHREAQVLSYAASSGFHTAALQHSLLGIGESLAGRAALEKKIVSSVDLSQTNNFSGSPLFKQENFLSYYGVPLAARGEVVGVLEIFHRSPLQPNPDWLQFLEALAAQAAIAVDNASLFTQLQSSIKSLYDTQEQLIRTARLSAVGELAAGIAHQINNPLTTVISDSQVLMRLTSDDDPLHVSAKAIYQAGWRAQRVVQRLLNFARPDEDQYAQSNVNETITESLDLIGAHLGRGGVNLQLHLASDLPLISADPHQLEEIWLNLLMNARDALSEERKGRIEVTSGLSANGDALEVSISDNGRGIRELDRANVFTPFFTTKGENRGNGLGLSVCQSIVRHHKGEIIFTSAEDVGTTFVVRLPLSRLPSL